MTDKISIKGTAPKYDEALLKQRQAARHNQYNLTSESHTIARGEIAFDFLTNVIELSNQGYELSNGYPIATDPMSYHAYMKKPEAIQQVEKKALDAQVKLDYVAWLESEHERYKQLLTAQLLQASNLKEAEKIQKAKAKLLSDIQKEVDATFSDLVISE